MGRRSRKRSSTPVAPPPVREHPVAPAPAGGRDRIPRTATHKSRREDAPQPPWAPFPLTELCILLSIILLGIGFLFADGERRSVLLGGGFVLVTLAAGELSVREHFAGYRSHSSLLAGICAIVVAVPVSLTPVPQPVRRSGGVGFRA
jgi:hypothetical protein